MTYDGYPPGMTRQDLIFVGEIEDPFQRYYENFDNVSDEELIEFIEEKAEDILTLLIKFKSLNYDDLLEMWKEDHVDYIQMSYEEVRSGYDG